MPHDRDGKLVKVGDYVYIPCVVVSVTTGEDYCNCSLESVIPMPPEDKSKLLISAINTRQIIKQ